MATESVCFTPTSTCMNEDNYLHCKGLLSAGCPEDRISVLESCPLQFRCSVPLPPNLSDRAELVKVVAVESVCMTPESPCMNEENYESCMDLLKTCPEENIRVLESCPVQFTCQSGVSRISVGGDE
eukprot:CAMPEP_0172498666 /NCGR_PEP_ID=MMETSP1066-20121228/115529_1 /TAXON_ID=671091 /ORGANISM="Coscinodiscus wailesii, Strain CCMP2513" /LENGTH=125 /DNA_ID=CAMNT_0013272043 /DNA_START=133 /DNA_END=510 /DNA_ORIENTATION=+